MDYEIEWVELGVCFEQGSTLFVDNGSQHRGMSFIDVLDRDSVPYTCVCKVTFSEGFPHADMEGVMQTVLMMAKARYGL